MRICNLLAEQTFGEHARSEEREGSVGLDCVDDMEFRISSLKDQALTRRLAVPEKRYLEK
jgi:hypothetical protein